MNITDLTEREKAILAKFRSMTEEQQDTCLRDLQELLKKKEADAQ